MPYKAGDTNPETGVPFKDEKEWQNYQYGLGQKAAATAFVKAGDTATVSKNDPYANYDWGSTTMPDWSYDQMKGMTPYMQEVTKNGYVPFYTGTDQAGTHAGYIDPHTNQITFGTMESGPTGNYYRVNGTAQYKSGQDYGLGQGSFGVIPVGHDASGTPTKFYAATPGGGGRYFDDLATAQESVRAYETWYAGQHPKTIQSNPGSSNTAPATSSTGGTSPYNPKNDLTVPQQGEQYYDSTKGFYTSPTQASKTFSDLKWDPTQPTDSQQLWAGIGGKYNDPNHKTAQQSLWGANSADYLDPNHKTDAQTMYGNWASTFSDPAELEAMYDRAAQASRTALDRRAASSGWGDSGAAARATGNLGIQFQDAATKAKMDWAKTGMGLAQASDTSRNEFLSTGGKLAAGSDDSESIWAKTGMDLAGQSDSSRINQQNALTTKNLGQMTGAGVVDTQNRANIWQGQEAANSAEDLLIRRANSDIGNATNIGNIGATIASSGLGTATSTELQLKLAALAAKQQAGTINSAKAYNDAAALVSSLGVVGKSADQILAAFKNGNASPDQILDDTLKKKGVTVTSTTSDAQIDELLRQFGNG